MRNLLLGAIVSAVLVACSSGDEPPTSGATEPAATVAQTTTTAVSTTEPAPTTEAHQLSQLAAEFAEGCANVVNSEVFAALVDGQKNPLSVALNSCRRASTSLKENGSDLALEIADKIDFQVQFGELSLERFKIGEYGVVEAVEDAERVETWRAEVLTLLVSDGWDVRVSD